MNEYFKYFGYGWLILVVAIIVNFLAKSVGLSTWYDFLMLRESLDLVSIVFMFVIYPSIIGAVIYWLKK